MTRSYTPTAKVLHWTMAAVIVAVWIIGYAGANATPGEGTMKRPLVQTHKAVGIVVLFLVVLRLGWRALHPPPPFARASRFTRIASALGHWALYALMLSMPLIGWAWTSAAGHPVEVLGVLELPPLMAASEARKALLGEWHRTLGWAIAVLVGGHVLFALKHALLDRDDVLRSMLPVRPREKR